MLEGPSQTKGLVGLDTRFLGPVMFRLNLSIVPAYSQHIPGGGDSSMGFVPLNVALYT